MNESVTGQEPTTQEKIQELTQEYVNKCADIGDSIHQIDFFNAKIERSKIAMRNLEVDRKKLDEKLVNEQARAGAQAQLSPDTVTQ